MSCGRQGRGTFFGTIWTVSRIIKKYLGFIDIFSLVLEKYLSVSIGISQEMCFLLILFLPQLKDVPKNKHPRL